MTVLYGGIEAGGTTFVCAVSEAPDQAPIASLRLPTTSPTETLTAVIEFFRPYHLGALGIASFGPLDIEGGSVSYGYILQTPKPGWRNTSLIAVAEALAVPVAIETDVNAAALAETYYGAALMCDPAVYITVGTGSGGGAVVRRETLSGIGHPEMGHMAVERRMGDAFEGSCPFHGHCLEGMASGVAIAERWGVPAHNLPATGPAWDLEAFYLGQALVNVIYTLAPERIVLGGGVMRKLGLLERVREATRERLGSYLPKVDSLLNELIVAPGSGDQPGLTGALELARRAATTW